LPSGVLLEATEPE